MAKPSDQDKQPQDVPNGAIATGSISKPAGGSPYESPLVSQARCFLQDENIRDASRSKMEDFLRSKGLNAEEIAMLLAESRGDSDSADGDTTMAANSGDSCSKVAPENDASLDTSGFEFRLSSDQIQQNAVPPIITYPEFLSRQQHQARPPALITTQRLLNALYISLSTYMSLYAGGQYMVKPMKEQLNEVRQELHEHANGKIEDLNRKLEAIVSKVPPRVNVEKMSSEALSEEDDVATCFHQSVGTQTSPVLEATPLPSSLPGEEDTAYPVVATHNIKLQCLRSRLGSLAPSPPELGNCAWPSGTPATESDISESLRELQQSLDLLPYNTVNSGKFQHEKMDDVHGKIRSEIRALKGTLLSARNFPSGVRGVVGAS